MKSVKSLIAAIGGGVCAVAAAFFSAASPTVRTSVKDTVTAVGNMLTGGMPEALSLWLSRYAVALVIAALTACAALCMWWLLGKKPLIAAGGGVGLSLIAVVAGAIASSWQSAVAAVVGSVTAIACMLLYGVLAKKMPKVFNRETISYIVFGVLTTVVSFVSQMLFASLGTPAWINTIGSWVCAVLFAYVVNKLFVFESRTDTKKAFFRELWLFFAARLVSLGMELVFMIITVDLLHFNEAVCKLIAQVFILVANYIFSKLIIFKKKSD